MWNPRVSVWETFMVFWRPMWCLPVSKDVLLSYNLNSRNIFFLVGRQHDELSSTGLLFIFSFLLSKIALVIQKFRIVLLIIDISTSVLILLVSKFLFIFNFIIQLKFMIYFFFHFGNHSFDSFINVILLFNLKWFCFSISPFNKKFIVFLWFIFLF
jgi:hypothetical protein